MTNVLTRIAEVYFGIGMLVTIVKSICQAVLNIKYDVALGRGGKIIYAFMIILDLLFWPVDLVYSIKYERMSSEEKKETTDIVEEMLGEIYQ